MGALWPSGRASNFESRGPRFNPAGDLLALSLSKTHTLPKVHYLGSCGSEIVERDVKPQYKQTKNAMITE